MLFRPLRPLRPDPQPMRACAQGESAAPAQFAPAPPLGAGAKDTQAVPPENARRCYRFAVCSRSGTLVDQHFGHATSFRIYDCKNGTPVAVTRRDVPRRPAGEEDAREGGRILDMAQTIGDCDAVICLRIGNPPIRVLHARGISVFTAYDLIEKSVRLAAEKLRQAGQLPIDAVLEYD